MCAVTPAPARKLLANVTFLPRTFPSVYAFKPSVQSDLALSWTLVFRCDEAAVRCRGGESDASHVWDEKSRQRDESGALHREAVGQDKSTQQHLHDDLHSERQSWIQVQGLCGCC